MNTPHKWAKEISHFVNGGEVEYKLTDEYMKTKGYGHKDTYIDLPPGVIGPFGDDDYEFRIKPQKKKVKVAIFEFDGTIETFLESYLPSSKWKRVSNWIEIEYENKSC